MDIRLVQTKDNISPIDQYLSMCTYNSTASSYLGMNDLQVCSCKRFEKKKKKLIENSLLEFSRMNQRDVFISV